MQETDSATISEVFYTGTTQVTANPALTDSWSSANGVVQLGQAQTLTATTNGGTGSSPWSYSIVVYNAAGSPVYNSLSPYVGATSNVVTFTQDTAWGKGLFTATLSITDSATTGVVVSNALTYSVGCGTIAAPATRPTWWPISR